MADFHQSFRNRIRELQEQIDSLPTLESPVTECKAQADQALSSITKLSAELADASGDLPSYDQRSYSQALKQLQDKLVVSQISHAPKAKFSFKNKRRAAPTSEGTSAVTPGSATPSRLKDPEQISARGLAVPAMISSPSYLSSGRDTGQNGRGEQVEADLIATSGPLHISSLSASGAYLRLPRPGQNAEQAEYSQYGQSCVVSDVKSSVISLLPSAKMSAPAPSSLTLSNISWSLLLAPNIKGPVHITGLNNSTVVLSCHQFRMHKSHNVDVYLHCSSRPIIEDCSNIKFSSIPEIFNEPSEGGERKNMFDQVDDFKWLRTEPSPNWRLMEDSESIREDTWTSILKRLEVQDKELQQGHAPDPAGVLHTVGRSEAENTT